MTKLSTVLLAIGLVGVTACGQPAPAPGGAERPAQGAEPQGQVGPRTLIMAVRFETVSLAPKVTTAQGVNGTVRLFNAQLSYIDGKGVTHPYLVEALPQLDTDSWRVLADGRMEVVYKLRGGLTWHDGKPLTADDFVFAYRAYTMPGVGLFTATPQNLMAGVEAQDSQTFVISWRRLYPEAAHFRPNEFDPLPRHILEEPLNRFEQDPAGQQEAFRNLPYWTQEYVGAGPFQLERWDPGSQLEGVAFAGHVLGRPKIDRVTFRIIPDSRTALANVLAGAIDISYLAVEFNEAITVRDEWARTGEGTVWLQPNQLRLIEPQMRPEYVRPADLLNRDVRRALAYAMDRPAVAEAANPGATMVVDSDGVPGTRFGDAIRARAFHDDYNPARAQSLLDAAGWRRGGDGFLEKAGQRFQLELLADRGAEQESVFSVMRENFRRIGIDVVFVERPRDTAASATYPGLRHRGAFANLPRTVQRFHSSHIATAETRWAGQNLNGLHMPALDPVIEAADRSVRTDEQAAHLAEVWRIVTDEAVAVGLYIRPLALHHPEGIHRPRPQQPERLAHFQRPVVGCQLSHR